jgi:hypothetical protein
MLTPFQIPRKMMLEPLKSVLFKIVQRCRYNLQLTRMAKWCRLCGFDPLLAPTSRLQSTPSSPSWIVIVSYSSIFHYAAGTSKQLHPITPYSGRLRAAMLALQFPSQAGTVRCSRFDQLQPTKETRRISHPDSSCWAFEDMCSDTIHLSMLNPADGLYIFSFQQWQWLLALEMCVIVSRRCHPIAPQRGFEV